MYIHHAGHCVSPELQIVNVIKSACNQGDPMAPGHLIMWDSPAWHPGSACAGSHAPIGHHMLLQYRPQMQECLSAWPCLL